MVSPDSYVLFLMRRVNQNQNSEEKSSSTSSTKTYAVQKLTRPDQFPHNLPREQASTLRDVFDLCYKKANPASQTERALSGAKERTAKDSTGVPSSAAKL